MPTVQHKNLPAAECHETKQIIGAITTDAGKVVTPSASVAGTGELRNLNTTEVLVERARADNLSTSTVNVAAVKKQVLSYGPLPGQVVTVNLEAPGAAIVRRLIVRKISAGDGEIAITAPVGSTIDGVQTIYLKAIYDAVELFTDGTDWCILATNVRAAGYQFVRDSQYTVGAPRAVGAGVRTKITIDNLLAGQENYRDQRYDLWDQANGRIKFTRPGDVLTLRIALRAKMAAANGYFDLETSFPAPTTGTNLTTWVLAKGSGTENRIIQEYSFFLDEFALAQGYMEIWVTPSVAMDFYGVTLLVTVNSAAYLGGNE